MFTRVFHVIPNPQRDTQQLVANRLVVLDGIELPAPLEPPVAILVAVNRPVFEIRRPELPHPIRRSKRLGRVVFPTGEQNGAAQRLAIRHRLRQRLAVIIPRFAPDVKIRPRFRPEPAVSRAIREERRRDVPLLLHQMPHHAGGANDRAPRAVDHRLRRIKIRIQQQRDVRLRLHFLVKQQIPLRIRSMGVARGVLQLEFFDDSGLATSRPPAMDVRSHDVHLHLAGCVAAQHRPILHQDHRRPVAGRRQCRAQPGHATARHQEIRPQGMLGHHPPAMRPKLARDESPFSEIVD